MRKGFILLLMFLILGAVALGQDPLTFADGEGIFTELVFVNPGADPVQFLVEFYDQEGQPADVTLEDFGAYTYFFVSLKAGEVWTCRTTGEALPLVSGQAQILLQSPAMAIATVRHGKTTLSEQIAQ